MMSEIEYENKKKIVKMHVFGIPQEKKANYRQET